MTSPASAPHPPESSKSFPVFDKILNFRDISTCTTTPSSPSPIKPGLVFRSAHPDLATPSDQAVLRDRYHIRTILDLRSPSEHLAATALIRTTTGDPTAIHPPVFPGLARICLDFNGSTFTRALVQRLSYVRQAQLVCYYLLGWRTEAIRIMATDVMAARGLVGLAEDSLEFCRSEVKLCFDLFADEARLPVLVHCTQGKDRTGLVVLLVELLMGTSVEGACKDYLQTQAELSSERDERAREMGKVGFPESFADCLGDWVEAVCEILKRKYGGVEGYLNVCGVDGVQQVRVRELLSL